MKITLLLLLALEFSLLSITARAQEGANFKLSKQYADSLFREGDFYRAHHEYDRLRYFSPDIAGDQGVLFNMVDCCLQLGELDQAAREMRLIESRYREGNEAQLAAFYRAKLLYVQGFYYDPLLQAGRMGESADSRELKIRSVMLAYCAGLHLGMIPQCDSLRTIYTSLIDPETAFPEIANHTPRLLSPALAGVLGIVPGGGYLYSGKPQSAIGTLIITSLLGYFAVESYHHDRPFEGIALSALTLMVDAGSIYGGIRQAYLKNDRRVDEHLDKFERFLYLKNSQ